MKRLLTIFLLIPAFCISQEIVKIQEKSLDECHQSLKEISKKIYTAKTDEDKRIANQELLIEFEKALTQANSFDYAFDSIKNDIHILGSEDGKFKLFNWEVPKADGTYEYYGFIQSKHTTLVNKKKTLTIQLYPLIDRSLEIKNPDNHIGDNKKWYGMWYYKIITKKIKSKTYYTLLGWDGNDNYSQKKIIDVLTFDANGTPRFGADVFNFQKKFPKRIIFEYSKSCNMSLKYSTKKDSIVFDHLAPTQPLLEGHYQYYCSDMSYDGFGFKKGKWNYGTNINAVNEKDEKNDKYYRQPSEDDKFIKTNQSNNISDKKKKRNTFSILLNNN